MKGQPAKLATVNNMYNEKENQPSCLSDHADI